MWVMEVLCGPDGAAEWRPVKRVGRPGEKVEPYLYDTKEEAEAMLRICYPDSIGGGRVRVNEYVA